ncbi:MAG: MFS transporter [Treponema sp.]|nr:MFS transporter [Treponema sp.]
MHIKFTPPFWLRQRLDLARPIKILKGRTLWVQRLVSEDTVEAKSRKYILSWNATANISQNLAGGNFLVGLYAILKVGDVLLGLLTTIIQLCCISQIFSPLLLDRFKHKKTVLLVTRVIFYTFFIIVVGGIPYIPVSDGMRINLLVAAMVTAYVTNSLASPGYSVLHIRSIPEASRADFFSILSLLNNICIYVFILICGYVVDFFRNRGNFLAGITAVRIIAVIFAAVEIYSHIHVHEFDEPDHAQKDSVIEKENKRPLLNPLLPLKNKQFTICAVLTGFYSFIANIPGLYYNSYLVNDVVAPYSYLGMVYFLSVPCMIIFVPFWNRVIKKKSWFGAISTALILVFFHYCSLLFVNRSNYMVLYTIAMIYYFSIIPGVNIVTVNLPFYRLPEGSRTIYIAFWAGFNSFMAMLGLLSGSFFIARTHSVAINFLGFSIHNKQLIMFITGILLLALGLGYRFFSKKEQL